MDCGGFAPAHDVRIAHRLSTIATPTRSCTRGRAHRGAGSRPELLAMGGATSSYTTNSTGGDGPVHATRARTSRREPEAEQAEVAPSGGALGEKPRKRDAF